MKILCKPSLICPAFGVLLAGCSVPASLAPVAQIDQQLQLVSEAVSSENKAVVHRQSVVEYRCKNKKAVHVQTFNDNKKTITLTYEQTSHTLSSAVAKNGKKKYSNIRWTWTEDNTGKGMLQNNRNKVLAEQCVKK